MRSPANESTGDRPGVNVARQRLESRLGLEIPDYVARDLVIIQSPNDVSSKARETRRQALTHLVERYERQIRYGCRNPTCKAQSCLSYRKRRVKAPLRRHTALSARALACELVSQRDPEDGLCRNESAAPGTRVPRNGKPTQRRAEGKPHALDNIGSSHARLSRSKDLNGHTVAAAARRVSESRLASETISVPQDCISNRGPLNATGSRPSAERKDPKSFTQFLFDTFFLRSLRPYLYPTRESPDTNLQAEATTTIIGEHDGRSTHPTDATTVEAEIEDAIPDSDGGCRQRESNPGYDYVACVGSCGQSQALKQNVNAEAEGAKVSRMPQEAQFSPLGIGLCIHESDSSDQLNEMPAKSASTEHDDGPVAKPISPSIHPPGHWSELAQRTEQSDDEMNNSEISLTMISSPTLIWMDNVTSDETVGGSDRHIDHRHSRAELSRFMEQSIWYCLKNPLPLLKSFYSWHSGKITAEESERASFPATKTLDGFDRLRRIRPFSEVLETLNHAIRELQRPPIDLQTLSRPLGPAKAAGPPYGLAEQGLAATHLDDGQAAHICVVALYAISLLTLSRDSITDHFELQHWLNHSRRNGWLFPKRAVGQLLAGETPRVQAQKARRLLRLMDVFDDMDANRLFRTVMETVSVRIAYKEMKVAQRTEVKSCRKDRLGRYACMNVAQIIAHGLQDREANMTDNRSLMIAPLATIGWISNLFLKDWEGDAIIQLSGPLGGAVTLLAALYQRRAELRLTVESFRLFSVDDKLDAMALPEQWLAFQPNNQKLHLLSYPFIFMPRTLVKYFRAISLFIMTRSVESAEQSSRDVRNFLHSDRIPVYGTQDLLSHLRPHMAQYFVLTVRRDNALTDAIDQIWRRQRRELMRPLKVLLGQNLDEGEEGLDQGGVQQEFFRIALAEAMDPKYGMFTIDDRSHMTWFRPGSVEQHYKFEALGILMSLAVYNAITLPITFPLTLYRKLLGLRVEKICHINDDWVELAEGLQKMLDWTEDDVGDVFMRTYEFSYDHFGTPVHVDMERYSRDSPWPPLGVKKGKEKAKTTSFEFPAHLTPPDETSPERSPEHPIGAQSSGTSRVDTPLSARNEQLDSEATLVTNANRAQYVNDYIFWLTDKSIRPQYEAFARGFYTCLDQTALSIFTPEALKAVVEGHQEINIDELESTTKYGGGFVADSPTIRDFWHVVRNMSPDQHKRLLTFVTASDRVPVNGMSSVTFVVQRNGVDDRYLPTSQTCFGVLLLPEYSSREVLEAKLVKALEAPMVFGLM